MGIANTYELAVTNYHLAWQNFGTLIFIKNAVKTSTNLQDTVVRPEG
jgi:hypothetical protein